MANKESLFNNEFIIKSLVNYQKPQFVTTGYQFKLNNSLVKFVSSTLSSLPKTIIEAYELVIPEYYHVTIQWTKESVNSRVIADLKSIIDNYIPIESNISGPFFFQDTCFFHIDTNPLLQKIRRDITEVFTKENYECGIKSDRSEIFWLTTGRLFKVNTLMNINWANYVNILPSTKVVLEKVIFDKHIY